MTHVTYEMSRKCENVSCTPVKDSVFELRTRMARMLSIVEITSQKNNTVYRNIDSDTSLLRFERRDKKRAREYIEWSSIKTLHVRAIILTIYNFRDRVIQLDFLLAVYITERFIRLMSYN